MNLYPHVVELEQGFVAQVVYAAQPEDALRRVDADHSIVWESDYSVESKAEALEGAKAAIEEGVRRLFAAVPR